jgi:hypothetical protein
MNLQLLQTELAALINRREPSGPSRDPLGDPYLSDVAEGDHLRRIQAISLWWRALDIGRYCVLTGKLMAAFGAFTPAVQAYLASAHFSPYIEELGPDFLRAQFAHPIPCVAAMAQIEYALLRVRKGDPAEYTTLCGFDPLHLIGDLLTGGMTPSSLVEGQYTCVVSNRCRDLIEVCQDQAAK